MDELLEAVGTVHHGRLILSSIYRSQRRQINNGVPTHFFPNAHDGHNPPEEIWLAHECDRCPAQTFVQDVDDAAIDIQKFVDDSCDDYPGDKVRQIADGLGDLFEEAVAHPENHNRQSNGEWETNQEVKPIDDKRVTQG